MKRDSRVLITALYERLSKDDEIQGESNSIIHQKNMLEEYAKQKGYGNIVHYTDDGYTGTNFDRPDWNRMLRDIEAGKIGTVIVKDLSRVGREYLQVGFYTEVFFREKNVRFIAISNGVDSEHRETAEFAPLLNIMNDWYVKDTSQKITAVLKNRGMSGKAHTTNRCIYGYMKDPADKDHWIVDEEAAEIVKRIYQMCISGKGPYEIARILAEEHIDRPEYYLGTRGRGSNATSYSEERRYTWGGGTVKAILTRPEYKGCTVNFRTKKDYYKDKRPKAVPKEDWVIFENTQEAIIDVHTWELVQSLVNTKRCHSSLGEANPLTGKIMCADCGAKMYNHRHGNYRKRKDLFHAGRYVYTAPEDSYRCSNNERGRQTYIQKCSPHTIPTKAVEKLVLETIAKTCDYAVENEAEFREQITELSAKKGEQKNERIQKRLSKHEKRSEEIERLIRKLYEDNINGKLSDKRFDTMLADYETELASLEKQMCADRTDLEQMSAKAMSADRFLDLSRKYTAFDTLTPEMLNEFVDRILVHEAEGIGANRTQEIEMYLNYIGKFTVPEQEPELTEEEIEAERKRQEKLEKKRACNRAYMARKRAEPRKEWAKLETMSV